MGGSIEHSPARIVQHLLIALGVAALPPRRPWPAYYLNGPSTPDNLIIVYNTVGKKHGKTMVDKERQIHHGVQVRVRGSTDDICYMKANDIAIALDRMLRQEVTVDEVLYTVQNVVIMGDPIQFPKPATTGKIPEVEEDRSIVVINCLLPIRQSFEDVDME